MKQRTRGATKTPPSGRIRPDDVRAMQALVKVLFGDSARDMAKRLECDRGHLKHVEAGTRPITADFIRSFRRLEREVTRALKDEAQLNEMERAWLVAAVERHAQEFSAREKRKIEKSLRG